MLFIAYLLTLFRARVLTTRRHAVYLTSYLLCVREFISFTRASFVGTRMQYRYDVGFRMKNN